MAKPHMGDRKCRTRIRLNGNADEILRSELAREKMWSRIHLIPLLTAEEDRDLARRHYADQAREKELLGKVSSPYNSDRFVIPLPFRWILSFNHIGCENQSGINRLVTLGSR